MADQEMSQPTRPNHVAVEAVSFAPSTLTNDVHPLFFKKNFVGCSDEIYDEPLPALRLATKFVTHPACKRYWATLMFGKRVFDLDNPSSGHRIESLLTPSSEIAQRVDERLIQIAKNVQFDLFKYPQHPLNTWALFTGALVTQAANHLTSPHHLSMPSILLVAFTFNLAASKP